MLADLFGFLRPPHPTDSDNPDAAVRALVYESRRRAWEWRINNTLILVVCFGALISWGLLPGGLPLLGSIAWAGDTDQRIKAAVNPIQSKVDAIEQTTRQIQQKQNAKELADLRQKLFETRVAQCKARTKNATAFAADNPYSIKLRELQELHYGLTSTYYPVPSNCDDL